MGIQDTFPPYELADNSLERAVTHLADVGDRFLQAGLNRTVDNSTDSIRTLQGLGNASVRAFGTAVGIILGEEDTDIFDKAKSIAGTAQAEERRRIAFFDEHELAYIKPDIHQNDTAVYEDFMRQVLYPGTDNEAIHKTTMASYQYGVELYIVQFESLGKPRVYERLKYVGQLAKEHAADVTKATGIALGAWVVAKRFKR
jgi:hypothetical protein